MRLTKSDGSARSLLYVHGASAFLKRLAVDDRAARSAAGFLAARRARALPEMLERAVGVEAEVGGGIEDVLSCALCEIFGGDTGFFIGLVAGHVKFCGEASGLGIGRAVESMCRAGPALFVQLSGLLRQSESVGIGEFYVSRGLFDVEGGRKDGLVKLMHHDPLGSTANKIAVETPLDSKNYEKVSCTETVRALDMSRALAEDGVSLVLCTFVVPPVLANAFTASGLSYVHAIDERELEMFAETIGVDFDGIASYSGVDEIIVRKPGGSVKYTRIDGLERKGGIPQLILRGTSPGMLTETSKILSRALHLLRDELRLGGGVISLCAGGGRSEVGIAREIERLVEGILPGGNKDESMLAFADEFVPLEVRVMGLMMIGAAMEGAALGFMTKRQFLEAKVSRGKEEVLLQARQPRQFTIHLVLEFVDIFLQLLRVDALITVKSFKNVGEKGRRRFVVSRRKNQGLKGSLHYDDDDSDSNDDLW